MINRVCKATTTITSCFWIEYFNEFLLSHMASGRSYTIYGWNYFHSLSSTHIAMAFCVHANIGLFWNYAVLYIKKPGCLSCLLCLNNIRHDIYDISFQVQVSKKLWAGGSGLYQLLKSEQPLTYAILFCNFLCMEVVANTFTKSVEVEVLTNKYQF